MFDVNLEVFIRKCTKLLILRQDFSIAGFSESSKLVELAGRSWDLSWILPFTVLSILVFY